LHVEFKFNNYLKGLNKSVNLNNEAEKMETHSLKSLSSNENVAYKSIFNLMGLSEKIF